jgi:hypothetical protein
MGEISLMREFQHRAAVEVPDARLFRRNVLFVKLEDRAIRAGIKGMCDLWAYVKGGYSIEIETKALRGVLNENQERWRDWCREWGVPWMLLKQGKKESPEFTVERWVTEFRALVLRTG